MKHIKKDIKNDKKFIEQWLNKCIKIEEDDDIICYITSPNILRQLKYNNLYNDNKEIKVDLTKLNYKDNVILIQDLGTKTFFICDKIYSFFKSKYNLNVDKTNKYINVILYEILNFKNFTTELNFLEDLEDLEDY